MKHSMVRVREGVIRLHRVSESLEGENLQRYKREQPVIDSEGQLFGKVATEEVLEPCN
ncbi:hypothetical protein BGW36DRAFT_383529 [Talaromyces proteolyticus]|uniref:Uncharacterized protein n=1 Tax=Talaromyces proteolyticus TaxID=1131652 RepID=A0AAD4KR14_9EURO|nr:uncharacterized protein BGW36DRAFT_383529 [Talaromyces proteolyticus]KAH8693692.1 hypothetical protein BGW36DRAFT_383529 [Talaromyces proteolyticus]